MIKLLIQFLLALFRKPRVVIPEAIDYVPLTPEVVVEAVVEPVVVVLKYLWDTKDNIKLSIRTIAHEEGLSSLQKDMAVEICRCESGFVLKARLENSPTSVDRGLFQINSFYHKTAIDELAYNPEWSTRWACKAIRRGEANMLWSASRHCWNKTGAFNSLIK